MAKVLVQRRYPGLGQVNADHIAEFSGGNARLALALARRVETGEGLSSFSDRQLFERLFWQGSAPDRELLEAAQVLSLVYSFSVSENHDGVDHLAALAGLTGRNRLSLYRATQSLVERQLAQKRGDWRAVLPHAVANRLAAEALNATPPETVLRDFQTSQHLLTSFGRRLGNLHDHETARDIVASWLEPGGILHEIENLDATHLHLLENAAPAAPAAVLYVIDACLTRLDQGRLHHFQANQGAIISDLLRAIAYEPEFFERSVLALARLAVSGKTDHDKSNASTRLCGLFCLYLSGTEATPDARLPIVRRFLFSSIAVERELGLGMLESALGGSNRTGGSHFHFGSRPRSFGYWPQSAAETDDWFRRSLALVAEAAASDCPTLSLRARDLLANHFRGLWGYPGLRPDLAAAARRLNGQRPWLKVWRALRMIQHYDYQKQTPKYGPNDIDSLESLERDLRPAALADRISAYVLGSAGEQFSLDDEFDDSDNEKFETSRRRLEAIAFSLGLEAANDPEVVDELSEKLFSPRTTLEFEFGKGLASGSHNLEALWNRLIEHVERIGDKVSNCGLLLGILEIVQSNDKCLADTLLDQAVENRVLRSFIVPIQCQVSLDQPALNRLLYALEFEDIQLEQFSQLTWLRLSDRLAEFDLCDILTRLLDHTRGASIVINGLGVRFSSLLAENCTVVSSQLKVIGVQAAQQWFVDHATFGEHHTMELLGLENVLEVCIDQSLPEQELDDFIDSYFNYVRGPNVSLDGSKKIHGIVARRLPSRFLDMALLEGDAYDIVRAQIFSKGLLGENPLSSIDVRDLMAWCRQKDFHQRLATVAKYIFPISEETESSGAVLSEQAHAILDETDDVSDVLSSYAQSIRPRAWSGSRADIISRRLPALERLLEDSRHKVRETARRLISDIRRWEAQERQWERRQAAASAHEHRFE